MLTLPPARSAWLRLGDPPSLVIADALGFHHTTTTALHINAGASWSQYAANRDRDLGTAALPASRRADPLLRGHRPPVTLIQLSS